MKQEDDNVKKKVTIKTEVESKPKAFISNIVVNQRVLFHQ